MNGQIWDIMINMFAKKHTIQLRYIDDASLGCSRYVEKSAWIVIFVPMTT